MEFDRRQLLGGQLSEQGIAISDHVEIIERARVDEPVSVLIGPTHACPRWPARRHHAHQARAPMQAMTTRPRLAAALTLTAGLAVTGLASGCGGAQGPADPKTVQAGSQVFTQAGCGTCHTLAAAGARGQIGPNLDELQPDVNTVVGQARRGGGGMPAYADRLSEEDIVEA